MGNLNRPSSNLPSPEPLSGPWYKEFWAWFVFAPLIVVVIACICMVVLAFKIKQDVVVDDYYKVGKTINQSFQPQQFAKDMGVNARIQFDAETGEIHTHLSSASSEKAISPIQSLVVQLSHPVEADKDRRFTLISRSAEHWRVDGDIPILGRWYVRVTAFKSLTEETSAVDELWRLQGEINFSHSSQIDLGASQ